jgi:hypothetical protein
MDRLSPDQAVVPSSLLEVSFKRENGLISARIKFPERIQDRTSPLDIFTLPNAFSLSSLASADQRSLEEIDDEPSKPAEMKAIPINLVMKRLNESQSDDASSVSFPITRVLDSNRINSNEVAEIFPGEFATTISTDKKPVLASYGRGESVILGGYDPTNKMAFMIQFSDMSQVQSANANGIIFYEISKLAKKELTKPIELHLRSGCSEQSDSMIQLIKQWTKCRKDLPMEVVSEKGPTCDDSDSEDPVVGLCIDSRTGIVSEYRPGMNLEPRKLTDIDVISILLGDIRIAYSPSL